MKVVDQELEMLVPLGIKISELSLGTTTLAVEIDDDKGAGCALSIFGHQISGIANLHYQFSGANRITHLRRNYNGSVLFSG